MSTQATPRPINPAIVSALGRYKHEEIPPDQMKSNDPVVINTTVFDSNEYRFVEKTLKGVFVSRWRREANKDVVTMVMPPTFKGYDPTLESFIAFNDKPIEVHRLTGSHGHEMALQAAKFIDANWTANNSQIGVSVGSDPEVLVVDAQGAVIPAWEFLPAKDKRSRGYESVIGFWDGVQAEITPNSQTCIEQLTFGVQVGLRNIIVSARVKHPGAKLTNKSVVDIPQEQLDGWEDAHVALGCSPSLNAYSDDVFTPGDARKHPYRYAGCHLHLGVKQYNLSAETMQRAVKLADRLCGIPLVGVLANIDNPRRRATYGRAGEYRLPIHGIEYRTPSSGILSDPACFHFAFNLFRQAVKMAMQNLDHLVIGDDAAVQDIINYCDVDGARKFVETNKTVFQKLFTETYGNGKTYLNAAFAFIHTGIESLITRPDDLYNNWNIDGVSIGASRSFGRTVSDGYKNRENYGD